MPDVNGHPDTQDGWTHGQERKTQGGSQAQIARDIETFEGKFGVPIPADIKAGLVAQYRALDPECAECQTFDGNPPAR
jgi:hypothetical protein